MDRLTIDPLNSRHEQHNTTIVVIDSSGKTGKHTADQLRPGRRRSEVIPLSWDNP